MESPEPSAPVSALRSSLFTAYCCCETHKDNQEVSTADMVRTQSPFLNGLGSVHNYARDATQSLDLTQSVDTSMQQMTPGRSGTSGSPSTGKRSRMHSRRRGEERVRLAHPEAKLSAAAPRRSPGASIPALAAPSVPQPACVQICCEEDVASRLQASADLEVEPEDPVEGVLGWVDVDVTVELGKGSRLGLAVRMCGETGGLVVTFVQSGGEIARWNKNHPEAYIGAGDQLALVDGKAVLESDIQGLCNHTDSNVLVTLTFKRPIRVASPIGL